jgi:A/G-specific adenine glycosylase
MTDFSQQLLSWYLKNKRDLPWRKTSDPYLIWLSEIILQQTRIEQGTPYYEKFVAAYPTIEDLAGAQEQEVLKLWQGLGYYSRARNLHETARVIAQQFDGKFPGTYPEIRSLKGIGEYTAAAIASICFDLPYAVVDGNVLRFLSRVFGIVESIDMPETKKKVYSIAMGQMVPEHPGDFNQAVMEFGATVCTPANPACLSCIFNTTCVACNTGKVGEIPARSPKAGIRNRYLHYLVLTVSDHGKDLICLRKRSGKDIWRNMYDFPAIERPLEAGDGLIGLNEFSVLSDSAEISYRDVSGPYFHLLTHQKLHAWFYRFHAMKAANLPFTLVPLEDIGKYPVPRLIERYFSDQGWFR